MSQATPHTVLMSMHNAQVPLQPVHSSVPVSFYDMVAVIGVVSVVGAICLQIQHLLQHATRDTPTTGTTATTPTVLLQLHTLDAKSTPVLHSTA